MLETLTVAELAGRCQAETTRYLRGQPYVERFCLELFRRAVVLHDNMAWSAVYTQYADAVRHWLGRRPGEEQEDEDVLTAFERFWKAVDAAKFARFGSLATVLQYLKMCAHTTRLDRARAARAIAGEEPLDDSAGSLPAPVEVESSVAERLDAGAFWKTVQDILHDERERLVIYLSYAIGLSPREICARHTARFPDVREIYRLKRSALERLRRALAVPDQG